MEFIQQVIDTIFEAHKTQKRPKVLSAAAAAVKTTKTNTRTVQQQG